MSTIIDRGYAPFLQDICGILRTIPEQPDTAAQVHSAAIVALRRAGFRVVPEYRQPFISAQGRPRFGKIDMMVERGDLRAAVEIDARKPRRGSLLKLRTFPGAKIVALRGVGGPCPDGIDALVRIPVRLATKPEIADRRTVGKVGRHG